MDTKTGFGTFSQNDGIHCLPKERLRLLRGTYAFREGFLLLVREKIGEDEEGCV